jgi:hypothetical protein
MGSFLLCRRDLLREEKSACYFNDRHESSPSSQHTILLNAVISIESAHYSSHHDRAMTDICRRKTSKRKKIRPQEELLLLLPTTRRGSVGTFKESLEFDWSRRTCPTFT